VLRLRQCQKHKAVAFRDSKALVGTKIALINAVYPLETYRDFSFMPGGLAAYITLPTQRPV